MTHRGEELVSGSRMPTLVFLGAELLPLVLPEDFELLQPAALSAKAAPSAVVARIALRM